MTIPNDEKDLLELLDDREFSALVNRKFKRGGYPPMEASEVDVIWKNISGNIQPAARRSRKAIFPTLKMGWPLLAAAALATLILWRETPPADLAKDARVKTGLRMQLFWSSGVGSIVVRSSHPGFVTLYRVNRQGGLQPILPAGRVLAEGDNGISLGERLSPGETICPLGASTRAGLETLDREAVRLVPLIPASDCLASAP